MNLVLCERYSTKMTAGACEKFRTNTPERCKGCDGPVADAAIDGPQVLTPVHAKPGAQSKEETNVATTDKKVTECGKCKETKPIMSRGLCGKCWHQENNAGTLDANFPSAYGKKKTVKVKSVREPERTKEAVISPTLADPLNVTINEGPCVTLSFADDDRRLYNYLSAQAKQNRRTIDQEILYRLDSGVSL